MPGSLAKLDPLQHPHWQPEAVVLSNRRLLTAIRRRAWIACAAFFVSLLIAFFAAWKMVVGIYQPRAVLGVTPHWVFGASPKPYQINPQTELAIWQQILEASFMASEKGPMPALADFTTPDVFEDLNLIVQRPVNSSYVVSFKVLESRIPRRLENAVVVFYRGRLNVIDQSVTTPSEAFMQVEYRRFPPTDKNATGWRMTTVRDLNRDLFFEPQRAAERERLLGPAAKR